MHLLDSSRRDLSGLSGFGAHEDRAKQSAPELLQAAPNILLLNLIGLCLVQFKRKL